MAKGINISVASDTREFTQGVKTGVIKPLDDAQKALEQVADEGTQTGTRLEAGFKKAQGATADFKLAQAELGRAMQQTVQVGQQSAQAFELSEREKTKISRETIKEIGNEAKQNAAETFGSFDGSAQSLVQGVQGTFGGLVASLGPVGLAIGAAGAAGIGIVNGLLQKGDENAQEYAADISSIAQALIDAGNTGVPATQAIVDKIKQLATGTDDASKSFRQSAKDAKTTGVNFASIAESLAGDPSTLRTAKRNVVDYIDSLKQQAMVQGTAAATAATLSSDQLTAADRLYAALDAQSKKYKDAAADQEAYAQSGAEALQQKATLIEGINDAYDDAAGAADDYVDSESGVFNTDAYIQAMQKKQDALREYQQNLVNFSGALGPDATSYLESLGADQASILLDSYKSASTTQQSALTAIWAEAGKDNSAQYMANVKAGLPATIVGPTVTLGVDKSQVDYALGQIQKTSVRIPAAFIVQNGQPVK